MKTRLHLALALLGTVATAAAHPGHDDAEFPPGEAPPFFLAQIGGGPRQSTGPLPASQVSITVEGEARVIHANGLPNHPTGAFPNRGNPNSIAAQNYRFRVPVAPRVAATPTILRLQPFGIAINGVLFDPGANEWWNNDRSSGWQLEPLTSGVTLGIDESNAHVQPNGAYHYHAIPKGLVAKLGGSGEKMQLLGWAADGFPIYGPLDHADAKDPASPLRQMKSSYRVKKGTRPSGPGGSYDGSYVADWEYVAGSGDLDECNGRTSPTPEFPGGIYHYVLTEQWPFIPRMFRGTPDESFARKGPPSGPGGPGMRGPGGPGGRRPPPPGFPPPPDFAALDQR